MGELPIFAAPLVKEEAIDPSIINAVQLPEHWNELEQLSWLLPTPIETIQETEIGQSHGVMFLATSIATRPVEIGRLTDIDLWNPREYRSQLLSPWHRDLTKAKKDGLIPTNARVLFLHHAEELDGGDLPHLSLTLVRRIALWTRFWGNQLKTASAS